MGPCEETPEQYRKRISKMTDLELIRHGKACADSLANESGEPNAVFKVQFDLCRTEWRRRHPKRASRVEPW